MPAFPLTQAIEDEILQRLSAGESLIAICRTEGFPSEFAVRSWALDDSPPGFASKYARARDLGLDCQAEKVREIAGSVSGPEDVPRARLEFDAARWYLSKLAPKRYGDATLLKHADAEGNSMKIEVTRVKRKSDG